MELGSRRLSTSLVPTCIIIRSNRGMFITFSCTRVISLSTVAPDRACTFACLGKYINLHIESENIQHRKAIRAHKTAILRGNNMQITKSLACRRQTPAQIPLTCFGCPRVQSYFPIHQFLPAPVAHPRKKYLGTSVNACHFSSLAFRKRPSQPVCHSKIAIKLQF